MCVCFFYMPLQHGFVTKYFWTGITNMRFLAMTLHVNSQKILTLQNLRAYLAHNRLFKALSNIWIGIFHLLCSFLAISNRLGGANYFLS